MTVSYNDTVRELGFDTKWPDLILKEDKIYTIYSEFLTNEAAMQNLLSSTSKKLFVAALILIEFVQHVSALEDLNYEIGIGNDIINNIITTDSYVIMLGGTTTLLYKQKGAVNLLRKAFNFMPESSHKIQYLHYFVDNILNEHGRKLVEWKEDDE